MREVARQDTMRYNGDMKLGISTACFFNRELTEDGLARIRALGVRDVEVFFGTRSEYGSPYIDAIARETEGLRVHSAHAMCTQFEPQLFAIAPRQFADARELLELFLSAAEKVGAPRYTFHGLLKLKRREYAYDYDRIASVVNDTVARCASHGIKLCYENVHYSYYDRPEFFATLAPLCPDLGAVLDVKQAIQSGYDWRDYLAASASRIETVHLCDMRGNKPCAPGQGDVDWDAFFGALAETDFRGTALLELYPDSYADYDELRRVYDRLRICAERYMSVE